MYCFGEGKDCPDSEFSPDPVHGWVHNVAPRHTIAGSPDYQPFPGPASFAPIILSGRATPDSIDLSGFLSSMERAELEVIREQSDSLVDLRGFEFNVAGQEFHVVGKKNDHLLLVSSDELSDWKSSLNQKLNEL